MVQWVKSIWHWVVDRYDSWQLQRKFKKQKKKHQAKDPFIYR